MVVCWKCGHEYDNVSVDFCVECGAQKATVTPTLDIDRIKKSQVKSAIQSQRKGAGLLNNSGLVELIIGDESIVLSLESRVTFGRDFDPQSGILSVDLTRFNALDSGVSRRHAAIQRNHNGHAVLLDLGSTNGTYLNLKQLKPLHEYLLNNDDEIRLGNLILIVHFGDD